MDSPKPSGPPRVCNLGAQTQSHLNPQAWAQVRAQSLLIPPGLGELNESQHTIALASAPTGCDSQLPAAMQAAHSWAPASGGGSITMETIPASSPPCKSPCSRPTSLQTKPGLAPNPAAPSVSKGDPSIAPAQPPCQGPGRSKPRQQPLARHQKTQALVPSLPRPHCLTSSRPLPLLRASVPPIVQWGDGPTKSFPAPKP